MSEDVFIEHDADGSVLAQRLYITLKEVFPAIQVGSRFLQPQESFLSSAAPVIVLIAGPWFPSARDIMPIVRVVRERTELQMIIVAVPDEGALLDWRGEPWTMLPKIVPVHLSRPDAVNYGMEFGGVISRVGALLSLHQVNASSLLSKIELERRRNSNLEENRSEQLLGSEKNATHEGLDVDHTTLVERVDIETAEAIKPTDPIDHIVPFDSEDWISWEDTSSYTDEQVVENAEYGTTGRRTSSGNADSRSSLRSVAAEASDDQGPVVMRHMADQMRVERGNFSTTEMQILSSSSAVVEGSPRAVETSEKGKEDLAEVSVFARRKTKRGYDFQIQVFVHLPEPIDRERARSAALEIDPEIATLGRRALDVPISVGDELVFVLRPTSRNGLECFDFSRVPAERLVWRGTSVGALFICSVNARAAFGTFGFCLHVMRNKLPIGVVKFSVEIEPPSAKHDTGLASYASKRFEKIFVSYASEDLHEVKKIVRAFSVTGQEYFMDKLGLEPGQDWPPELYRQIESSDAVMLFWSESARKSPWVRQEIEHAVKVEEEREAPSLLPYTLYEPPIPPPWDFIAHRHFGDALWHFSASGESEAKR